MTNRGFTILIILLILVFPALSAQESRLDSLLHKDKEDNGPEGASASFEIAKHYMASNPDTAAHYTRNALEKFQNLDLSYEIASAHALLSRYYTIKRDRNASISEYTAVNLIANETDDLKFKALAYQTEAWHHYIFENYPEGLETYLNLISVCEELGDYQCHSRGLMNSSLIYTTMEYYADAERHLKQALAMAREENDSMNLLIAHVNISANFRQTNQPDSSVYHAQKGLEIAKAIDSKIGIIKSLNHLAVNSLDLGQFEAAENYAEQILTSDIRNLQSLSLAHKYKAAALDSVGRSMEALEHAERSMQIASENGDGKYILNSYEQLYLLHKKAGNLDAALHFFEQHEVLKDSLFNLEKNVKINQLKEKYESEKHLMEIASLRQDKAIQELKHRRNMIILFALLFGALLVAAAIYFIFRNKTLQQEKESLKIRQRLLRAQINPHFIFNSLNSIQNLVYNKTGNKAARYLANFAALMRNTLESSFDEYIGLDEEVEAIRNYMELQKLRFPEKFDYSIEIDEFIDPEELMVPPMLSQPFLENAVLHAFPKVNGHPGRINIKIEQYQDQVEIKIEDNGVGIQGIMNQKRGHTSRALQITRDRLSLLRNGKHTPASIDLKDRQEFGEKGTLVDIHIPLVKAY